jgi:hypothetical protein
LKISDAAHAACTSGPTPARPRLRLLGGLALALLGVAVAAAPAQAAGEVDTGSDTGSRAAPAYAARLPPAATLHYGLRSGIFSGRGSLRWQPDALAGYTLSLEGTVLGVSALSQGSRGGLGAQGLAPEHFLDQRRGREARTVQFDEAAAQIRFSAGMPAQPWRPRAQDRLSWMLQLSAVAAANPALMQPGAAPVELFVVGARGKAEIWAFQLVERADIRLPAGPVSAALHLRRLPGPGHHTQVDVWLDPARHHLPVRLRLAEADGEQAFELRLEAYTVP